MRHRTHTCRRQTPRATRSGVILLVMLGMLAMFTLIATTFIISAGHFRRGAFSHTQAEQTGDPVETLLQQALMQIVRGSNNPQSVIGPHSLLEDMYGDGDSMTGMVVLPGEQVPSFVQPEPPQFVRSHYQRSDEVVVGPVLGQPMLLEFFGIGFGWDKEPGIARFDDDKNGVVDDVTEVFATGGDDAPLGSIPGHPMQGISNSTLIDNVDNYYAGRVITFVTGEAAGRSSHIVRSKVFQAGNNYTTVLWVKPLFGDVRPSTRDRFVINGRPFNGTGFGYTPFDDAGVLKTTENLRALSLKYKNPVPENAAKDVLMTTVNGGVPIALLPNPTDPGYRRYLETAEPIVNADEDYDAPDYQNMLLAYRMYNSRTGRYETVMPSLHRPDLVNYFTRNLGSSLGNRRWTDLPPHVRRRIILRPDPSDHYDYTQENVADPMLADGWNPPEPFIDANLNGQWDIGESYTDVNNNNAYDVGDRAFAASGFDAVNGPWDVDNDGDGDPDSVWVDLGLPVSATPDGRFVKPLFAVLVLDLDGRINVNAHGSPAHYGTVGTRPGAPPLDAYTPIDDPYTFSSIPNPKNEERIFLGSSGYLHDQTTYTGSFVKQNGDAMPRTLANGTSTTQNMRVPIAFNNRAVATQFQVVQGMDLPRTNQAIGLVEPAVGQGFSPAVVNIAGLFVRRRDTVPHVPVRRAPLNAAPRINHYRHLLEGYTLNTHSATTITAVQNLAGAPQVYGRYGESHLNTGISSPTNPTYLRADYPGSGVPPRAGITNISTDPRISLVPDLYSGESRLLVGVNEFGLAMVGDDDVPGAPGPVRNGPFTMTTAAVVTNTLAIRGNGWRDNIKIVVTPTGEQLNNLTVTRNTYQTGANSYVLQQGPLAGIYGTPSDFDADGHITLDIMGRPIYNDMGDQKANDAVDDPAEVNLNRRYSAKLNFMSNAKYTTLDANFSPSEFARCLREWDTSAEVLPDRLHRLLRNDQWGALSSEFVHGITSESWDLPCPHVAPTPELARGLRALNLPVDNPSIGDLLRARFYLASGSTMPPTMAANLATVAMRSFVPRLKSQAVNIGSLGGLWPHFAPFSFGLPGGGGQFLRLETDAIKRKQCRLLSPDLGLGLRMDVNAPLGNGLDDDNDGVVDEPAEWLDTRSLMNVGTNFATPVEPLWMTRKTTVRPVPAEYNTGVPFDGNRDGYADNRYDEMARQQCAKELYCLMMLLMDENYAVPLETPYTSGGPGLPETHPGFNGPSNSRTSSAQKWLTARKIAQWAINCVDFRDRDAIMTPFEFDVDPFLDNDGDFDPSNIDYPNSNGTWDVDGYVADDPEAAKDSVKPYRGVVWGCEFPDLILTETLAFHDRRTQNRDDDTGDNGDPMAAMPTPGYAENPIGTPPNDDQDWDQVRFPQGTAVFELYATGNPHLTIPLQTTLTSTPVYQSMLPRELYTVDGRLNLSLTVTGRNPRYASNEPRAYPVWRLAITRGVNVSNSLNDPNNIAARVARNPSTCSLNPTLSAERNFNLLPQVVTGTAAGSQYEPVTINRIVAFTPMPAVSSTPRIEAAPEAIFNPPAAATTGTPDVFYQMTPWTSTTAYEGIYAYPGDYVVVGPYREAAPVNPAAPLSGTPVTTTGFINITTIGSTTTGDVTAAFGPAANINNDNGMRPPVIDLGFPGGLYGGAAASPPALRTVNRPFVVTSVNGVDEYPVVSVTVANAYLSTTQASLSPDLTLTNLVLRALPTNASRVERPTYAQIRRPITMPCAIQDTVTTTAGANFGRPIGLNISEPVVNGGVPTDQRHRMIYKNTLTTAQPATTTNAWLAATTGGPPIWATQDTWKLASGAPPAAGQPGPYPDVPFDGVDTNVTNPVWRDEYKIQNMRDATYLCAASVFLQRLADPTRVWDEDANPYLTIDWMPIDLTIFNGEYNLSGLNTAKASERGNDAPATGGAAPRFGSRQRGGNRPYRGLYSYFDLWSQPNWLDTRVDWDTRPPRTDRVYSDPAGNDTSPYRNKRTARWLHPLQHTLGYLNAGYHAYRQADFPTAATTDASPPLRMTMVRPAGNRQALQRTPPFGNPPPPGNRPVINVGWYDGFDVNDGLALYIGAPYRPFNSLIWNNRPFASALETMLVPCSSPSRLLYEYDMRRTALSVDGPQDGALPYDGRRSANEYADFKAAVNEPASPTTPAQWGYQNAPPFKHLLNFFTSSEAGPVATPGTKPNFYRIFEYLTVPSRFSGCREMQLHGGIASNGSFTGLWNTPWLAGFPQNDPWTSSSASVGTPFGGNAHPGWPFTAPFNYLPTYREPGRVNINTIPILSEGQNVGDPATRTNDAGAAIWRSVTNEFFPNFNDMNAAHFPWFSSFGTSASTTSTNIRGFDITTTGGVRGITTPTGARARSPINPGQDTVDNFFAAAAGMRSDWPKFDLRGPNATWDHTLINPNSPLYDDRARLPNSTNVPYSSDPLVPEGRMDPQKPAWICNPFRAFSEDFSATVPAPALPSPYRQSPPQGAPSNQYFPQAYESSYMWKPFLAVDSTLFRRRDTTWFGDPPKDHNASLYVDPTFDPLFALNFPRPVYYASPTSPSSTVLYSGYTSVLMPPPAVGGFGGAPVLQFKLPDYRNSDRNPFFRYQLYTKLGSVITTRSNVYAIWVTVGFFECERVIPDPNNPGAAIPPVQNGHDKGQEFALGQRYPDGYRILREVGIESGDTKRHRAFAIFDRSIPVGFRRGENLNVDQAFLMRQIIE